MKTVGGSWPLWDWIVGNRRHSPPACRAAGIAEDRRIVDNATKAEEDKVQSVSLTPIAKGR